MATHQSGNPPGIPLEVIVFRLDDSSTDHEVTSDGSFQHVELEAMDTYEDMYTAETEAVVEIPIPNDLITDEDREFWKTLHNQSSGEKNWRHITKRVCRMVRSNAEKEMIEAAELASRIRAAK